MRPASHPFGSPLDSWFWATGNPAKLAPSEDAAASVPANRTAVAGPAVLGVSPDLSVTVAKAVIGTRPSMMAEERPRRLGNWRSWILDQFFFFFLGLERFEL